MNILITCDVCEEEGKKMRHPQCCYYAFAIGLMLLLLLLLHLTYFPTLQLAISTNIHLNGYHGFKNIITNEYSIHLHSCIKKRRDGDIERKTENSVETGIETDKKKSSFARHITCLAYILH